MNITRTNYMLFFLDYYEGVLSEGEQEELMRFLDEHADLKVEFFDFEMVKLPKDNLLKYPDKHSLKKPDDDPGVSDDAEKPVRLRLHKPASASRGDHANCKDENDIGAGFSGPRLVGGSISAENYEEMFVAYAEGDLDAATEQAVEAFAATDDFYARELALVRATKVEADPAIQYEGKSALKRHYIGALRRKIMYYSSAAAAVLLLAALVYNFFPLDETQRYAEEIPVAGDKEVPVAVVAPPAPQQETFDILPIPEGTDASKPATPVQPHGEPLHPRQLIADLKPAEQSVSPSVSPHTEGPFSLDLTAFRRPTLARQPLDAQAMEPNTAARALARSEAFPANIKTRNEFMWLAYLNPADLPVHPEDEDITDTGAPTRREVGLAELAINRLSDNTNLNLQGVEQVISGDRSPLANIAGEGIARVAPATERILGIETARNEEGRLVGFAVGDFFSISRR